MGVYDGNRGRLGASGAGRPRGRAPRIAWVFSEIGLRRLGFNATDY